jgi:hypothetical protein
VEGSSEHSNGPSGSIKCWEILGVAVQLAPSQEGLSSIKSVVRRYWKVRPCLIT